MFQKIKAVSRRIVRGFILVGLLLLASFAYKRWTIIQRYYLEKDPPQLEVVSKPQGVGVDPQPLILKIIDSGAGIDEVSVKAQQRDKTFELLREQLGGKFFDFVTVPGELPRVREQELKIKLPNQKEGLRPGKLRISVLLFDRAVWSNRTEREFELDVDFTKPVLEALTPFQNAALGGCEMVFYNVRAKGGTFQGTSGVNWRESMFPGLPARLIDPVFQTFDSLYVSLFPIPLAFDDDKDKLRLFAKDTVGNSVHSGFMYSVRRGSFGKRTLTLDSPVCGSKAFLKARSAREDTEESDLVNLLLKLEGSASPRTFRGPFRQFPFRQIAFFGEERSLLVDKVVDCTERTLYTEYALTEGTTILAPNAGKVAAVMDLGSRGNTLILDHGLGLFSLYFHLGQVDRAVGEDVVSGDPLGKAGKSGYILPGLKEEARFGFELRLHGVPIRPTEWWDGSWQREHIDQEVRLVKRNLGILSEEELEQDKSGSRKGKR